MVSLLCVCIAGKTVQITGRADKAWAVALCMYMSTLAVEWSNRIERLSVGLNETPFKVYPELI